MLHTNIIEQAAKSAVAQIFERSLHNAYPPSGATMIKNALKLQSVGVREERGWGQEDA